MIAWSRSENPIGTVFLGIQLAPIPAISASRAGSLLAVPVQMAHSHPAYSQLHLLHVLASRLSFLDSRNDPGELLARSQNRWFDKS